MHHSSVLSYFKILQQHIICITILTNNRFPLIKTFYFSRTIYIYNTFMSEKWSQFLTGEFGYTVEKNTTCQTQDLCKKDNATYSLFAGMMIQYSLLHEAN